MRVLRPLFFVLIIGLVAACGGTATEEPATSPPDPTTETTDDESTPTPEVLDADAASVESGFTAQLTGAVETTVSGPGYFRCTDATQSEAGGETTTIPGFQEIAIDQRTENVVQFYFPRYVGPGQYDLTTLGNMQPGEDFVAVILTDPATIYGLMLGGTLTLDSIPTAAGETASGSFSFTVSNGTNQIQAEGTFKFAVPEDTSFCTPQEDSGAGGDSASG